MGKVAIALIGALGGAAAAIVGYFLVPGEVRIELLEEARREAYVDFFEALELSKQADRYLHRADSVGADDDEAKDLRKKAMDVHDQFENMGSLAVTRIAVYGEAVVVRNMVKWYRADPSLETCKKKGIDDINEKVQIYQSMRQSLMPDEEPLDKGELAILISKCTLRTNESEQG